MKDFSATPLPISSQQGISAPELSNTVSNADVMNFQQEMNKSTSPPSRVSFAEKIIDKFSSVSDELAVKKSEYEYQLEKASRTGQAADILAATRAMADYQLQVQLTTKVASKTNTAIEKLTNLQ